MDWLEKLKVGDKVILSSNYSDSVVSVTRLTKTLIITDSGRFSKGDGWLHGGSTWSMCKLLKANKEAIKEIGLQCQKRKIISTLQCFNFNQLDLSVLQKINNLIQEQGK